MSDPVLNLSESQKACLRLVAQGMTSKEIAMRTGLAPQTVDTYLKTAMARLGASNRRDAARLLLDHELSHKLGSPTAMVVDAGDLVNDQPTVRTGGLARVLAPPPLGGTSNDLSPSQRTLAVLKVAALSAVIVVALTLLIAGAMQTFR